MLRYADSSREGLGSPRVVHTDPLAISAASSPGPGSRSSSGPVTAPPSPTDLAGWRTCGPPSPPRPTGRRSRPPWARAGPPCLEAYPCRAPPPSSPGSSAWLRRRYPPTSPGSRPQNWSSPTAAARGSTTASATPASPSARNLRRDRLRGLWGRQASPSHTWVSPPGEQLLGAPRAYGASLTATNESCSTPSMVRGASVARSPTSRKRRSHVARPNTPQRWTSWTARTLPPGSRRRNA